MRLLPVLLVTPLFAFAEPGPVRLCTGSANNPYHAFGAAIAKRLEGKLKVDVKLSRGSWDNLEGLDAPKRRCDVAIVQEDALILYLHNRPRSAENLVKVAPIFSEFVHLVCNRRVGTDSLYGLHHLKHKIVANRRGSGTYVTWELFQKQSPELRALTGPKASFQDGMIQILDQQGADCMAFVARLGNSSVDLANRGFGSQLRLVAIPETKLAQLKNAEGRRVYKPATIPKKAYPNLATGPVPTVSIDAFFLMARGWTKGKKGDADTLAGAVRAEIEAATPPRP